MTKPKTLNDITGKNHDLVFIGHPHDFLEDYVICSICLKEFLKEKISEFEVNLLTKVDRGSINKIREDWQKFKKELGVE